MKKQILLDSSEVLYEKSGFTQEEFNDQWTVHHSEWKVEDSWLVGENRGNWPCMAIMKQGFPGVKHDKKLKEHKVLTANHLGLPIHDLFSLDEIYAPGPMSKVPQFRHEILGEGSTGHLSFSATEENRNSDEQ